VRLHIPVFTNKDVWFYIDDVAIQMKEGECWYMNANLRHRVSNNGSTDRIHLVIDCIVNDWMKEKFRQSEKIFAKNDAYLQQQQSIIAELRLQQTVTATALADELEKSLCATSAEK
jgi:hypothetical protein